MKRIAWTGLFVSALALTVTTACTAPPKNGEEQNAAAAGDVELVSWEDVDDSMNDIVKESKQERFRIEVEEDDMIKGDPEALVTIVEFSDFQCPYCSQFTNTIHEVMEGAEGVRVVFKQFPLVSIHPDAMLAAQAALAANAQGKGWELHDKMFDGQKQRLTRENIEKWAAEVEVPDMDAFKKALDDKTYEEAVKSDMEYAQKMAVNSTPTFFLNGRQIPARSADAIKAAIEEEKKLAQKLIDKGAEKKEIYARIMRASTAERKQPERKPQQRPGMPDPSTNFAVPTDDRPATGPEDALVTIVEFSDFQCPFCSRVNPTMAKIKETYPEDVRVVFRNLPLPMHPQAPAAAKAGLAAHKQGKFWEMHDAMFGNQRALSDQDLEKYAGEIGLDVAQFKKDMADPELKTMVDEDMETAQKFGARGTPAFFVNGRFISGALPFEAFDSVIKEEKAKAEKFLAEKGVDKKELYAEMSKGWEQEFKAPPPPPAADHKRRDVSTDGLYARGAKNPKITIVECSDFDCPYCKRGAGTVDQVLKEYGDKVQVHFAHNPLPMHKNAEPAHRASIAAGKQGKFWEMHDKLFENQKARSEEDFVKFAEEIGIDTGKFKTDYAAPETAKEVQDRMKQCAGYEVRGVPGFLINGRLMSGAQPYPRFKEVLEEELNGGFEATAKKADDEGEDKAG